MLLSKLPRRSYTHGHTPIEKLDRLSTLLGGPTIYIKRDDLLGLAGGGNKTRKLEFLLADAIAQGKDTIITCGALQSNHCRLTLAAAVKEGLKCHLILEEGVDTSYNPDANGNNLLYKLLGAEQIRIVHHGADLNAEMNKVSEDLTAAGRNPYVIPVGGSNELGSVGYVACAQEILQQTFDSNLVMDHVVVASGSGGTQAGLIVGFNGNSAPIKVTGINVSRPNETQVPKIIELVKKTTRFLQIPEDITANSVHCYDQYVGEGYTIPTNGMIEAVQMLARTEGILLDSVYTGKVMAGLIDLIRKGVFTKDQNVLFVHTGGSPSLYANHTLFNDDLFVL
ncbi:D-cysteine desulfhydrase [Sporosarcina sp. PTS2304]|uniref:D-cysteine desulfhydrase n=1 Tax=Sporosarcina sp. PTS2304 TaxID=2283194 RepID=UPI000E0DA713|nr:D-cysteine desulfhydrase [Sporosarcina sp. PTS2304]AXI00779.1 D-cysteine desulfhydrase [Sporosarcina sp. PTS2304]